jgi:hypothetical protein
MYSGHDTAKNKDMYSSRAIIYDIKMRRDKNNKRKRKREKI